MKTIELTDLCPSFTTNSDAVALYAVVRDIIRNDEGVVLSFHGVSGMTTSFLSSSFGAWVDDFGFDVLRDKVTITNYTPYVASFIRRYLDDMRMHNHC